jgi:hypothetical protein
MGLATRQRLGLILRALLAGAVVVLPPLLFLEDLDPLLQQLKLPSPMVWPDWASIPASLAVGLAAAAVVGLFRRWEAVPRLEVFAQRVDRYFLFLILFPYALSKVLRIQFRLPYVTLDTPLGDVNGYTLAWRFFGYSHGHEVFVALAEWAGPALLLWWRTTTLGACVTAVVMSNVVLVNFTHGLPVQRFSSCLLALTVYLLLPDGRRLLDFFVFNRPTEPRPVPASLIGSRWLAGGFKVAWVALAAGYSFTYLYVGDSQPTPIMGTWTVDAGDAKPSVSWRTVYFERGINDSFPFSVRRDAGARPERGNYEFDAASRHLRMNFSNKAGPEKSFDGSCEIGDDGRLRLRGELDGRAVEVELLRKR